MYFQFVGSPCGQHGPYTFYKAFKFKKNSRTCILSLGEFFFVKIFKDVEVCIGELQLLWEDRYNPGSYLSMVRLYFLPEQTPEGRKTHHGEVSEMQRKDYLKVHFDNVSIYYNLFHHMNDMTAFILFFFFFLGGEENNDNYLEELQ